MHLTKEQACRFLLSHQGLGAIREFSGKEGILAYIDRVGCIQYDPINVVGPNHELVLQARLSDFDSKMLYALLYTDRKLLDGWDKNMSIYGVNDWPYFSRLREHATKMNRSKLKEIQEVLPRVLEDIAAKGPVNSDDLEYKERVDWWWAPTRLSRAALETLYFQGELIVHHKNNTRKVYDLAKKHLPSSLWQMPDPNRTEREFYKWYVKRRIGSIGLLWNKASDAWLGIQGLKSACRNQAFADLICEGQIKEVQVEGLKYPLYLRQVDWSRLVATVEQKKSSNRAEVIAPLDNLLWDRKLIKALFGLEYTWEVYKPKEERTYGYYVLPVICGDRFVARFEPRKDKETNTLVIENWWWEEDVQVTENLLSALQDCLTRFSQFTGTTTVRIKETLKHRKDLVYLTS